MTGSIACDDRIALYKTGLRAMQIALRPATKHVRMKQGVEPNITRSLQEQLMSVLRTPRFKRCRVLDRITSQQKDAQVGELAGVEADENIVAQVHFRQRYASCQIQRIIR